MRLKVLCVLLRTLPSVYCLVSQRRTKEAVELTGSCKAEPFSPFSVVWWRSESGGLSSFK